MVSKCHDVIDNSKQTVAITFLTVAALLPSGNTFKQLKTGNRTEKLVSLKPFNVCHETFGVYMKMQLFF